VQLQTTTTKRLWSGIRRRRRSRGREA